MHRLLRARSVSADWCRLRLLLSEVRTRYARAVLQPMTQGVIVQQKRKEYSFFKYSLAIGQLFNREMSSCHMRID